MAKIAFETGQVGVSRIISTLSKADGITLLNIDPIPATASQSMQFLTVEEQFTLGVWGLKAQTKVLEKPLSGGTSYIPNNNFQYGTELVWGVGNLNTGQGWLVGGVKQANDSLLMMWSIPVELPGTGNRTWWARQIQIDIGGKI